MAWQVAVGGELALQSKNRRIAGGCSKTAGAAAPVLPIRVDLPRLRAPQETVAIPERRSWSIALV